MQVSSFKFSTMFQQLFHPPRIILIGVLSLTTLPVTLKVACDPDWAPSWLLGAANKVNACPPTPVAMIPSILLSAELKGVIIAPISRDMPDTTVMSDNRLELGKILVALASVDTPQSRQAIEAVRRYDVQSKKTILGIAKLNSASELTAKTTIHVLEGLIEVLTRASSKHKSARVVNKIISFQQDQVDAWVKGLQDQLRRLHEQSVAVQADLASCDNHLWQIYDTAGAAKGERELIADAQPKLSPLRSIFVTASLRESVSRAIESFEELVLATRQAQKIVDVLSERLVMVSGGIEAAYRYHDKMLVIDMSMEEMVDITVQSLSKLKKAVEGARVER